LRSLDNHVGQVQGLALRPGTGTDAPPVVASISADRTVRLWQPTIGRMVRFTKVASEPLSVTWSPDGSRLLAGCADGRLRILDPDTGAILGEQPGLTGWLYTLAVPPSGRELLAAGEGRVQRLVLERH
jgi:WD40 repeat protein